MKYLIVFFLIFSPISLFAQSSLLISGLDERAVIEITPRNPSPNEPVTARVKSTYNSNLQKAEITWYINKAERKSEIGGTSFQFQSPAVGNTIELSVLVERETGSFFGNFLEITPASVDLIYEANTYTPPFYRGRSLFTYQSTVTVAALATIIEEGIRLPKNRIIYNWYRDGEILRDFSGVGRDSLRLTGNFIGRPFNISVIAESVNSDIKAERRISINPTNPQVLLYENNPVQGSIFERALTGVFNFDREEVGITAVPFFFNAESRNSAALRYSWSENNQNIGDETFGSFINYLNPDRAKGGIADIGVNVEHFQDFMQSSRNSFRVNVIGGSQSGIIRTNESSVF
jgi:hypothetical protein